MLHSTRPPIHQLETLRVHLYQVQTHTLQNRSTCFILRRSRGMVVRGKDASLFDFPPKFRESFEPFRFYISNANPSRENLLVKWYTRRARCKRSPDVVCRIFVFFSKCLSSRSVDDHSVNFLVNYRGFTGPRRIRSDNVNSNYARNFLYRVAVAHEYSSAFV